MPNLEILIKNIVFAFYLCSNGSTYILFRSLSVFLSRFLCKYLSFSHAYTYTYSHLLIVERKTLWIITCLISSLHPYFHKNHLKNELLVPALISNKVFWALQRRISSSRLIFKSNRLLNIWIRYSSIKSLS